MSILIKGMDMPKNCNDCPLNYDSIDCMVVDNALREKGGGDFLFDHERHPNCPLISVPKHGRLIDADALDVIGYYGIPQGREDTFDDGVMWLAEQIDLLPTIIPAEEGVSDELQ